MAEMCLDCYNKDAIANNEKPLTENDVVMDEDLCEWCGKIKPCIITIRRKPKRINIFNIFRKR